MNRWAILAALMLLLVGSVAAEAADVMLHPNVNITVDIPRFGLVVPNTPTWSFTVTSDDTNPDDGILFEASGFDYKLRVFSNTAVTVTLNDGRVKVGNSTFYPLYEWGGGKFWARDPQPSGAREEEYTNSWTLYTSGGPVRNHEIALTGFKVYVGTHADPDDPTSPINPDITQFAPVEASGVLVVTVAAAGS